MPHLHLHNRDSSHSMSSSSSSSQAGYKSLPGYLGNLTPSQEYRLKEMYLAMMQFHGTAPLDAKVGVKAPPPDESTQPKKSGGFFGLRGAAAPEEYTPAQVLDELKRTVQGVKPGQARTSFRDAVRCDHPDQLVLRFLRARKWDTIKAMNQFGETLKWRETDWNIPKLLEQGEEYFIAVEPDEGFIQQYKTGKVTLHGHDKQGRPLVFIHVALHDPRAQSEKAMERYTLNVIESARLCLNREVTTAAVIFDLGGFGLANMDYSVVKFIIACFERFYPECLGYLFIHRAPWVFSSVWQIIKGWIDPVVASKISFTKNEKDLLNYIDSDQIPKPMGGTSDFVYKYIPPQEGESKLVHDTAHKQEKYAERDAIFDKFEQATLKWVMAKDEASSKAAHAEREKCADELYEQFWHLDPYIRSRSIFDRNGSLGEFKPQLQSGNVAQPTL